MTTLNNLLVNALQGGFSHVLTGKKGCNLEDLLHAAYHLCALHRRLEETQPPAKEIPRIVHEAISHRLPDTEALRESHLDCILLPFAEILALFILHFLQC